MVSIENLRDLNIFRGFSDDVLEKFQDHLVVLNFDEDDIVFREGDPAETFYFLKFGKILLETKISEKISFAIGAIKPGYSFGWSAMLDEGTGYSTRTVCAEPCQIYAFQAAKFKELLSEEPQVGHQFMQRLLGVVKNRLDHRTSQFVTVLRNHPDIENLI